MATARKKLITPAAPVGQRARAKLANPVGSYFAAGRDKEDMEFSSTGCALIDEALGGGPVLGRVINIVGDKSTGKTGLAMEIMAQTLLRYPNAWARYGEAESAWDRNHAEALGLPVNQIILNPKGTRLETIEQWYEDMDTLLDKYPDRPGVYVVDSLDAMSDAAEMDAEFDAGSFGAKKPKKIGELFRRLVGRVEAQRVMLVIVSQMRDKIGVTFGETKTRSGGRALDFYATHIVWLGERGQIKRTVSGVERVTGFNVEGAVKKNKAGLAFRKAKYPFLFGYGIDDLTASVEWLFEVGEEKSLWALGMRKKPPPRAKNRAALAAAEAADVIDPGANTRPYEEVIREVRDIGGPAAQELRTKLTALVRVKWRDIELATLPKASKY